MMNERMYELINQCFIGTTDGKLSELNTVANVEKFAELIVKECADIALNHPAKLPSNAWKGVDVPSDTSNRIKRHFGVE
jgi:hypothetical protein